MSVDDDKIQHAAMNDCLRRALNSERRRVGADRGARSSSLEAEYDRFTPVLAELAERVSWISFSSGSRSEGSGLETVQLACETASLVERTYFLVVVDSDAALLTARVDALQRQGQATRAALMQIRAAATRWMTGGDTALRFDAASGARPVDKEDWQALVGLTREVERRSAALAVATCDALPGLRGSLGGSTACAEKVANYHLGHCGIEPDR